MAEHPLTTEQILAMLAAAPQHIAGVTASLAPAQLHTAPASGEWSANDVLAHLRSGADMWGSCMAAILAQDKPVLRAINPRTWIESTDYPDQEFGPSLHAYTAQRRELLTVLEPLTPQQWSRTATVKGAGKTLTRSVQFYAQWLAKHERPHIKQITRIALAMRAL